MGTAELRHGAHQTTGTPVAAIEAVSAALERATQAAHQMCRGIADAQSALSAAAYSGPDSDEPDEKP